MKPINRLRRGLKKYLIDRKEYTKKHLGFSIPFSRDITIGEAIKFYKRRIFYNKRCFVILLEYDKDLEFLKKFESTPNEKYAYFEDENFQTERYPWYHINEIYEPFDTERNKFFGFKGTLDERLKDLIGDD